MPLGVFPFFDKKLNSGGFMIHFDGIGMEVDGIGDESGGIGIINIIFRWN